MLSISESPPAENTIAVEQDSGPDNWVPGPLTHHSHLEEVVPTLKNVPGNELEFRSNFRQNYSDALFTTLDQEQRQSDAYGDQTKGYSPEDVRTRIG